MTPKRLLLIVVLLGVLGLGAAIAWAMRHPEIAAITPPDPASFDRSLVQRGEELAGMGNCSVCHSVVGQGRYAGGLALPTPFGTIYTTNITPDVETGIGSWSEAAFIRAMRQGVDREGNHLYPAFPYDYYARVSDEDLGAIYAYLMTREPVAYTAPQNELGFPFNQRILLEGWKVLFHDTTPFQPDPNQSDDWNRGAYLVEGLGHCGACHSPRNQFGAAAKTGADAYQGGFAEGWYVPPLTANSPGPIPWTEIALVNYMIDGWDRHHGIAGGPMTPVANDLYAQDEDDVFAIAAYIMWLKGGELPEEDLQARRDEAIAVAERLEWGNPENPPVPDDPELQLGAQVFQRECSECHELGGKPALLALTTTVNAPTPHNLIMVSFYGIQPPPRGVLDRSMPGRRIQINDEQMIALARFVRDRFTDLPPWENIAEAVAEARSFEGH